MIREELKVEDIGLIIKQGLMSLIETGLERANAKWCEKLKIRTDIRSELMPIVDELLSVEHYISRMTVNYRNEKSMDEVITIVNYIMALFDRYDEVMKRAGQKEKSEAEIRHDILKRRM